MHTIYKYAYNVTSYLFIFLNCLLHNVKNSQMIVIIFPLTAANLCFYLFCFVFHISIASIEIGDKHYLFIYRINLLWNHYQIISSLLTADLSIKFFFIAFCAFSLVCCLLKVLLVMNEIMVPVGDWNRINCNTFHHLIKQLLMTDLWDMQKKERIYIYIYIYILE